MYVPGVVEAAAKASIFSSSAWRNFSMPLYLERDMATLLLLRVFELAKNATEFHRRPDAEVKCIGKTLSNGILYVVLNSRRRQDIYLF